MDSRPFIRLPSSRVVSRPELPSDLAAFYSDYEGVSCGSDPRDRNVRLCTLDEAILIGWKDVHILGQDEVPGWRGFAAIRIGISSYFDEILYVLDAPICARGAILAIGIEVGGPGGDGPHQLDMSLVLASSFDMWIQHMKGLDWVEYGLGMVPGFENKLSESQERAMLRYYKQLNPSIEWGI